MAGFIRRFSNFPSQAVLTAIEGVNIIDLAPPGSIEGVGTGFANLVGEFADMTYAVEIDPVTGAITSDMRPIEVFSAKDLLDKGGPFDETIGQFGGDMGNGFVELRNKVFARLAITPINLASGFGLRVWRELPTCVSQTDPNPVVPVSGAVVEAGREFRDSPDRIKIAAPVFFSDAVAFVLGVDGSVTSAGAAATQPFDSAGSTFVTDGVEKGDILVVGVFGAAAALGANAGTYRIVSVASETQLVVQQMDGVAFDWTTGASLPFRVHQGETADSGPDNQFSEQAGYLIPCRPLTDGQGTGSSAADGNWTVGTLLTPAIVPPAITATTADPLSGLSAAAGPTGVVAFDAETQAPNAPNDAALDALYSTALDSLLQEEAPARELNLVWAARKSNTIRSLLRQHCINASAVGIGRTCTISPELDIAKSTAFATVTGDAAPGVGATRHERTFYSWPPARTFVPEAVGVSLPTADGKTTDQGDLDVTYDGFLTSLLSNLASERNPGEATNATTRAQAGVVGIARNVPALNINNYIVMRQKGIAGLRVDRAVGSIIQSGITSSLISGEKNINRRRMADEIEDSIALRLVQLSKLPLTESLKDTILGEIKEYMDSLLSPDNPAARRINDYSIDGVSGNTPELEEKGIFVVIVNVRTLSTADFITVQVNAGEGVLIVNAA